MGESCTCKLEWFKSQQIWVDGNFFVQKELKGSLTRDFKKDTDSWKKNLKLKFSCQTVNCDRDLATLFYVQEEIFNCPHACLYRVHYIIFWERGDGGFWLCDIASLVMYCIDAPQRIVTKSLDRTPTLFAILKGYRYLSVCIRRWDLSTGAADRTRTQTPGPADLSCKKFLGLKLEQFSIQLSSGGTLNDLLLITIYFIR